jgi:hypothetical protein
MKKTLLLLPAIAMLIWAAWQVNGPSPVQADTVPEKYQGTIQKGLDYLAKNQQKDGHWEGDGGAHPVAMTGLVGLALFMERHGRDRIVPPLKYSAEVRRAVDWLIDNCGAEREGLIYSGHDSERSRYMQGHGLATIFLSGVLRHETDAPRKKKLRDILERAVKYIVQSQSSQGGWYDTSKTEGHDFASISATIIQIQALQAAMHSDLSVPADVIGSGRHYLKSALDDAEKQKKPGAGAKLAADAAAVLAGIVVYPRSRFDADGTLAVDPWREKWESFCKDQLPTGKALQFGRDELAHCYFAEEHVIIKSDAWNTYRTALFDTLQARQNKDGSWPAGNGISVGPVYSTAVWCTALQLDKQSHPSIRHIEVLVTTTRAPRAFIDSPFAMILLREPRSRPSMSRGSS